MSVVIKKQTGTEDGLITKEEPQKSLLTQHSTDQKSIHKKQPYSIRSYAIAEENEHTLQQLKQEATDAIGRPISSSALLRALLHYLSQQSPSWTAEQLHPLIEKEIEAGRVWGTKVKKGSTE